MSKQSKPIETEGQLEPECAWRILNQIKALQDFLSGIEGEVGSHIHLLPEGYDKLFELKDKEIEDLGVVELTIINDLIYAMSSLSDANKKLEKIIGIESKEFKEHNPSYR